MKEMEGLSREEYIGSLRRYDLMKMIIPFFHIIMDIIY